MKYNFFKALAVFGFFACANITATTETTTEVKEENEKVLVKMEETINEIINSIPTEETETEEAAK